MRPFLVCGNANVETVVRRPLSQLAAEGGSFADLLSLNVSGVGANLVRALDKLGQPVRWLTAAADDPAGHLIRGSFGGVDTRFLTVKATPQSLATVQPDGSHTYYRDLKDTPEAAAQAADLQDWLGDSVAALMTNIGWTRPLLPVVRAAGVPIVTDVQDLRSLDNPYDVPYFAAAEVLLFSAVHLPQPQTALHALAERSPARVIIAGCGERGALLLERGQVVHRQPAFPVQAAFQGGAGDTLTAAFAHFHFGRQLSAREALRLACAAAALKIQTLGSGNGHPTEAEVLALASRGGGH